MRFCGVVATTLLLGAIFLLSSSPSGFAGVTSDDTDRVRNFVEVWGYKKEGKESPTCKVQITVKYVGEKTRKKPGIRPGRWGSEVEKYHAYKVWLRFEPSTGEKHTSESVELQGNPPDQKGAFSSVVGRHMVESKRGGKAGELMGRKAAPSVLSQNLKG